LAFGPNFIGARRAHDLLPDPSHELLQSMLVLMEIKGHSRQRQTPAVAMARVEIDSIRFVRQSFRLHVQVHGPRIVASIVFLKFLTPRTNAGRQYVYSRHRRAVTARPYGSAANKSQPGGVEITHAGHLSRTVAIDAKNFAVCPQVEVAGLDSHGNRGVKRGGFGVHMAAVEIAVTAIHARRTFADARVKRRRRTIRLRQNP